MKLIAFDITNLTDARYFAARGAHMIGFSTSRSSVEEVNAIKEWVDIPDFFLQFPPTVEPDYIWEWQERTGIKNFLVSQLTVETTAHFHDVCWMKFFHDISDDEDLDLSYIFIAPDSFDNWKNVDDSFLHLYADANIYLQIDPPSLNIVQKLNNIQGLLISGSAEEAVGVKSYDDIDDFLDQVAIEY